VITGLISQGYPPVEAAVLGVYLHGKAGDIAAHSEGEEAVMAGDIIKNLGKAFLSLHS
jgi:NAD(P)H-hydrate epimerase